jgi:hypothetical protein
MTPLHIVAEMESRLILPPEGIHLDALLMAAVARRDDAPPLYTQADAVHAQPLDIPIALSACGLAAAAPLPMGYAPVVPVGE